jgi:hypothetical protein
VPSEGGWAFAEFFIVFNRVLVVANARQIVLPMLYFFDKALDVLLANFEGGLFSLSFHESLNCVVVTRGWLFGVFLDLVCPGNLALYDVHFLHVWIHLVVFDFIDWSRSRSTSPASFLDELAYLLRFMPASRGLTSILLIVISHIFFMLISSWTWNPFELFYMEYILCKGDSRALSKLSSALQNLFPVSDGLVNRTGDKGSLFSVFLNE